MKEQCWSSAGDRRMFEQSRNNAGAMLEQFWSNAGPVSNFTLMKYI
jgi:hypothetical protein